MGWKKEEKNEKKLLQSRIYRCLLYTSPSPRDQRGSRMPSSAWKKKRINCWERQAWVSTIWRESTREELLIFSRKKCKARTVVGRGGGEPAMWPRIWVTSRREREKKGKDNKWDEKKKKKMKRSFYSPEFTARKSRISSFLGVPAVSARRRVKRWSKGKRALSTVLGRVFHTKT